MKIITLLLIILLLPSANTYSQKHLFRMHRFYCLELFNIELSKPKGFKVTDGYPSAIMKLLLKSVHYGDIAPEYNKEKEMKVCKKIERSFR